MLGSHFCWGIINPHFTIECHIDIHINLACIMKCVESIQRMSVTLRRLGKIIFCIMNMHTYIFCVMFFLVNTNTCIYLVNICWKNSNQFRLIKKRVNTNTNQNFTPIWKDK